MKTIAVILVAFLALQYTFAKPKGKPATEPSPLDELAANTQKLVNNVTKTLGIEEIPDSKKVAEVFSNNAKTLATKVQEVVDKLKAEAKAHQPEVDSVIKQVEKKLSETATSLQQAAGPEATAKAKEVKKNLDDGLKSALAQAEKLLKAVEPDATKAKDDLQKAAKSLFEQISQVASNLQTEVNSKIAEHQKAHKN